eukprot:1660222-Rhodomonas_salina.1
MEFQAVVLAGGTGTRLFPLTEGVVKSMLPVANTPLISYQLHLLERSGFKEAIVTTTQAACTEMGEYLSQVHKGSIVVDMCVVDEELETADVLRAIKDKIKKDFVVVSGDLITDVFVHHLADVHRINDATCTVLLRGPKPEVKPPAGAKPAKVEGAVLDYVGLDPKQSQLLCLVSSASARSYLSVRAESAADVEEKLVLSRKMLMAHPNVSVTNKVSSVHAARTRCPGLRPRLATDARRSLLHLLVLGMHARPPSLGDAKLLTHVLTFPGHGLARGHAQVPSPLLLRAPKCPGLTKASVLPFESTFLNQIQRCPELTKQHVLFQHHLDQDRADPVPGQEAILVEAGARPAAAQHGAVRR